MMQKYKKKGNNQIFLGFFYSTDGENEVGKKVCLSYDDLFIECIKEVLGVCFLVKELRAFQ